MPRSGHRSNAAAKPKANCQRPREVDEMQFDICISSETPVRILECPE
jgi:hypothetical protein